MLSRNINVVGLASATAMNERVEASAYNALVAASLAAVKGTLFLALIAVFSVSLFRLVIVVDFDCITRRFVEY